MLGRLAGEAAEIPASDFSDSSARRVVELVTIADWTVANAEAHLRRGAPRNWQALGADPAVRSAALEVCVLLSELDADRTTRRNDAGRSVSDTGVGHILASRTSLTLAEAAHALAILVHHRRQLAPALLARLAGQAPAPASTLLL